MGPSRGVAYRAGAIAQGYGGYSVYVPPPLVELISPTRPKVGGSSSSNKQHQEDAQLVALWARAVEVNSRVPIKPIEGFVRLPLETSSLSVIAEHVSDGVSKIWSNIKVTAKRVKR